MADADGDRGKLRGLALGTLFPGFIGRTAPPHWLARLAADGLGGVVLFGRNIDPSRGDTGVAALTAALHEAGPQLVIGIDEEGGNVSRLDVASGSSLPGNAALGALDDPAATAEVAAELGARLRACGVDVNFAPVADVDSNLQNPVIGARAFGADPKLVSRQVAAFVTGQQGQGVAATAKHFPGHGGTSEDSHLTVPVLDAPLDVVRKRDLLPFRAAVQAGVKVVMTAHVRISALDGDIPATLSHPVITGVLREELGFDGVVMTDGLDMNAISRTVGHAEGAVRALLAGVDALCIGGDTVDEAGVVAIADALVDAVVTGRLPRERLAGAAARVRALRQWSETAGRAPASAGAAAEAARRSLVVHGDVTLTAPPLVVELDDTPSLAAGRLPWGMGSPLAARLPGTIVVRYRHADGDVAGVLSAHPDRRVVVSVRGLRRLPWQARAVAEIRSARPDLIVVDHDVLSPADLLGEHYILAHGAARVTAEAAADVLLNGRS